MPDRTDLPPKAAPHHKIEASPFSDRCKCGSTDDVLDVVFLGYNMHTAVAQCRHCRGELANALLSQLFPEWRDLVTNYQARVK